MIPVTPQNDCSQIFQYLCGRAIFFNKLIPVNPEEQNDITDQEGPKNEPDETKQA